MNKLSDRQVRDYLKRRKEAAPELEAIRRRELRNYGFRDNEAAVASLFQLGTDCRIPRKASGMAEWYRRLKVGRE